MKQRIKICVVFFSIIFAANTFAAQLDRIIAIVNDTPITQTEFDHSLNIIKQQLAENGAPAPADTELHKKILDQLVNRKLQLQAAEQNGIKIKEDEIDKAISTIASNNKLSVDDIYQKITEQGSNKIDYRKEIKEELTLHHIQQAALAGKISITPEEIDRFLHANEADFSNKEYHLENIMVELAQNATKNEVEKAKQEAHAIVAKLHQGSDFQSVASSSDLGWRKLAEIPTIFAKALIVHKTGDIIGPFKHRMVFTLFISPAFAIPIKT